MLSDKSDLTRLGWNSYFEKFFQSSQVPGSVPGRVMSVDRGIYEVSTGSCSLTAEISGRFRSQANNNPRFPAVGDWVVLVPISGEARGIIHAVLPDRSRFSRQSAGGRERLTGGRTMEQIVAANIDTVFIVGALDQGRSSNARRIERYLTLAWSSGATPVVVLNKADLCEDVSGFVESLSDVSKGVDVYALSAKTKSGLEGLRKYVTEGKTVAFLGSSGVGKSALINALLGSERQEVGEIRDRDRTGRHTTSRRELILMPAGGVLIDTPGMREIQMWATENDLEDSFAEISDLAEGCRFRDCRHQDEPGCAVKAAIQSGELARARYENFLRLRREISYHESREEGSVRISERLRWKKISKAQKTMRRKGEI